MRTGTRSHLSESWWKIRDDIINLMNVNGYEQGDLCNYMNGSAVEQFF